MSKYHPLVLLFIILMHAGCQQTNTRDIPDVTHLQEEINAIPFAQILLSARDTIDLERLSNAHPVFTEVFASQVLPPQRGKSMMSRLDNFRSDSAAARLHKEVERFQPWNDAAQTQLALAFALAKHYFEGFKVPQVYTCISLFEVGTFTIGEDILGIGLEFYLGESFPYNPTVFPDYIARTMSPEYLAPKSVHVLLDQLVGPTSGDKAIDHMIRNGIVLYLKEKLLPNIEETLLHEFTSEQMEWVKNNEGEIWAYLVGEDLLHETNERKYRKLVFPSPTVPGMPDEAPGRVGNWIGYQIVRSFADRTGASLTDLMKEKDGQKVLTLAKYRPRRVSS